MPKYEDGVYSMDGKEWDNYIDAKGYIDATYGPSDLEEIPT